MDPFHQRLAHVALTAARNSGWFSPAAAETRQSLAVAQSQLVPILTVAAQRGLLGAAAGGALTQLELEQLWQALCADAEIRPAARQVAMTVSVTDVLLLLSDLLTSAAQPR